MVLLAYGFKPIHTWDEFLTILKVRFGPSAYEDPVGAFTKLRQTTTVEDYQSQFEVLSNKISGLTEEFRINTSLSGLQDYFRIIVTMFKPTALSAAFGLARLQEEEVSRRTQGFLPKNQPQNTTTQNSTLKSLALNLILRLPAPPNRQESRNTQPNPPRKPTLPIRRISSTQMQETRDRELCYYCDLKFHPGHWCNWPKVFSLEGMWIEEEEESEGVDGTLVVMKTDEPT